MVCRGLGKRPRCLVQTERQGNAGQPQSKAFCHVMLLLKRERVRQLGSRRFQMTWPLWGLRLSRRLATAPKQPCRKEAGVHLKQVIAGHPPAASTQSAL